MLNDSGLGCCTVMWNFESKHLNFKGNLKLQLN